MISGNIANEQGDTDAKIPPANDATINKYQALVVGSENN